MSPLLDSLKTAFDALPASLVEANALGDARREALRDALTNGLPSSRSERWKYTPLRALAQRRFVGTAPTPRLHPAVIADIPSPRLVFVNGQLDAVLTQIAELETGLSLQPWSLAFADGVSGIAEPLERQVNHGDDAFVQLNAALSVDGALLRVATDAKITRPVHLVVIGTPAEGDLAWHLRHVIDLGENSSVTLVEHHLGNGTHRHLSNQFVHIHLQQGARLLHARLQDEDASATIIARTEAVLAADTDYRRVDLELGAAMSRHELNVHLQGERANLTSGGVLLAGGRRHVDTQLGIVHVAPDTSCDLLWRGLAAERGRAVFHGGITIRAGADGANAALSNKNLLLSNEAEIDTQPVLEIYADEVKAAHGATVGRLDESHLFYLRARGIPEAQARSLLTLAFAREALGRLLDPDLIEQLSPSLENRLASLETKQ